MARASPAPNGFGHTFACHKSIIKTAFKAAYLTPAIVPGCTFSKRTQALKYQAPRRHASVTASPRLRDNSVDGGIYSKHGLPLEVKDLVSSPRRLKPGPWATAIEPYLPLNLRLGHKNASQESIQHERLRPIRTLPDFLSIARLSCQADLLSYIGVYQERWEAVIWLVKAMTEKYPSHEKMENISRQLPPLLWSTVNQSLDAVTESAIEVETPPPSEMQREHSRWYGGDSLDQYPWLYNPDHRNDPHISRRKSLGQIWQSLGTMILQAADRSPEDPSYSIIMTQVFRILGHLHRINALPDSIYNYTPATDPTVLQRPPTLYVLSKRIMSTLSDVEFGLQWEETVTKALSQGYDLAKAPVQPRIREFGPELWLDLVLWACVEGGWISEGAWIVMEIQKRMDAKDTRWSTISWAEICEKGEPTLDWISIIKYQIEKTRLNQVGGLGMATGSDLTIDMGTRTISREVVLALLDGLLNDPLSTAEGLSMTAVELRRSIIACKSLLECNHPGLDGNFMYAVILRVLESFEDVKEQPGALSRLLDLRSTEFKQTIRGSSTTTTAHEHRLDDSAAVLGLHHRNLHYFSVDGNQEGSLQTLRKIQSTVDTHREGRILAFARELKERLREGDDASDLSKADVLAPVQPAQIPLSALASFIDMVTESRLFDLGNWLLLNEDIDGGLIDPALCSDENLQPALLRFGTATSNSRLLTKVLLGLKMPLPHPVIHALLRFQVALGKWTAVEELLEYVKFTPNMGWRPSDVTAIAKAILQMEHESVDKADDDSISRALSIIQNLVNGKYNSKADPSQLIPDFSQARMANQLGRILQTLPGSLSKITTRLSGEDLRAHTSAEIMPHTFNVIVQVVADLHGSHAGKKLWDQWCRVPDAPKWKQPSRPPFGNSERVVTPNLSMLRSVLRPALATRRRLYAAMKEELIKSRGSKTATTTTTTTTDEEGPSSVAIREKYRLGDDDQEILSWGITMFKKFGVTEEEINVEIPGSFPRPQHQRKKKKKKEKENEYVDDKEGKEDKDDDEVDHVDLMM